ncbi:unnamed protein product [Prunus armeniaca]|uniref:Uncharacterized protein n=1 Tax=Prunus armeniaca TaxID=36596 RepID=A0A6J5WEJ9_PRUAR|nr:unnamed protein product [Prunus armeniaca]CAB4298455.1 unnamed protein product [Prunus armeniaca]
MDLKPTKMIKFGDSDLKNEAEANTIINTNANENEKAAADVEGCTVPRGLGYEIGDGELRFEASEI